MRRVVFPVALALSAVVSAPVAYAQTPEVERLLRHGVELRQQGNHEAALAEFEQAHALAGTPRTLAQVALAEQALGRWVAAESHLREALRSTEDPWIIRNRGALDGALGVIAQHVGQVMVTANVTGAMVTVNGREGAPLPWSAPVRIDAGEVEISARFEGRTESRRVQVSAGETAVIPFEFARPVVTPPPPPLLPPPPVRITPPNGRPVTRVGSTRRTLGWISLAAGGVGFGVGVAGLVLKNMGANDYNGLRFQGGLACPGTTILYDLQRPECQSALDQEYTGRMLQWAGLISGGALTITGVILLVTAPRASETRPAVVLAPGPGDLGVSLGGRF